ncbi:MAG: chromosomal replication initiator protein DnaA [Bacteroidaceae bacterium]|nr:chromosomal replication initiator protein DnaA [Bacteroidaceae bacterium]
MGIRQQNTDQRWAQCLQLIRNNVQPEAYQTWFANINPVQFDEADRKLYIGVPSHYFREHLESHYLTLLRTVLTNVYGKGISLYYNVHTDSTNGEDMIVEETRHSNVPAAPRSATPANQSPRILQELDSQLNPIYTFDNFVEGDSNKLPRTVGLAIAQNPKQVTFNPLFIYGNSGVGKTHLVNAIGTRLKELHPEKRVLYVSAHLFQVQYTDSVIKNTTNDFISFYQSIDVLIIDDVQEFVTKATQQTFFHIFNHLHQNGRQLILTSDRPPIALQGMEERLLTRFKWGLLAELEQPNETLREDILRCKIRENGLRFPESVIQYIAKNTEGSVRSLEGMVHSLMAYSVVWNSDIDVSLAERVLAHTMGAPGQKKPKITPEQILNQTCAFFNIDTSDVLSNSRKANVVAARQIAMYLVQKHTRLSTTKIGMAIGGRNHATVIHSCKCVEQRIGTDHAFSEQIGELEAKLME